MINVLAFIAVGLTVAMFLTKQALLSFPCVIFWAIFGAYAYTESLMTWDIYYFIFFASLGMSVFSVLAGFALREKSDTYADEELDGAKSTHLNSEESGTDKIFSTEDKNSRGLWKRKHTQKKN